MSIYGIFIEPSDEIGDFLIKKKLEIGKLFGKQEYLDHPPHMTIYCGDLIGIQEVCAKLSETHLECCRLVSQGFHVFYNDLLCGGSNTLCIRFTGSRLFELQSNVAASLKSHILTRPRSFNDEDMQNSWNLFGFPFVGQHWIPHMTIASLEKNRCDVYLQQVIREDVHFDFICRALSVWRINDGVHEKINEIALR